jgi:hypothetical protein
MLVMQRLAGSSAHRHSPEASRYKLCHHLARRAAAQSLSTMTICKWGRSYRPWNAYCQSKLSDLGGGRKRIIVGSIDRGQEWVTRIRRSNMELDAHK